MKNEFYKNLKIGDQVIVRKHGYSIITTVERFTNTLIVTKSRNRFKRCNGNEYGASTWSWSVLEEATPENIKAIMDKKNKNKAVNYISSKNMNYLSLKSLEKIVKIIEDEV